MDLLEPARCHAPARVLLSSDWESVIRLPGRIARYPGPDSLSSMLRVLDGSIPGPLEPTLGNASRPETGSGPVPRRSTRHPGRSAGSACEARQFPGIRTKPIPRVSLLHPLAPCSDQCIASSARRILRYQSSQHDIGHSRTLRCVASDDCSTAQTRLPIPA